MPPRQPRQPDDRNAPTRAMPAREPATTPRKRPSGVRLRKAERERAQAVFLESFAVSANITAACKRAGVSRETMYQWQEHDEAFSLRYKKAEAEACDVIRAAIHEHAIRGWDEYVVSMGKIVYGPDGKPLMQHKYDSTLLAKLASARLPEFREKLDVTTGGERLAGVSELVAGLLTGQREMMIAPPVVEGSLAPPSSSCPASAQKNRATDVLDDLAARADRGAGGESSGPGGDRQ